MKSKSNHYQHQPRDRQGLWVATNGDRRSAYRRRLDEERARAERAKRRAERRRARQLWLADIRSVFAAIGRALKPSAKVTVEDGWQIDRSGEVAVFTDLAGHNAGNLTAIEKRLVELEPEQETADVDADLRAMIDSHFAPAKSDPIEALGPAPVKGDYQGLTEQQVRVLDALELAAATAEATGGSWSYNGVGRHLGLSHSTMRKHVLNLRRKGYLTV